MKALEDELIDELQKQHEEFSCRKLLDYGDAETYRAQIERVRSDFKDLN
ncbi:MAG: hypothetical protein ACU84H_10015 [Gammaproteobacteria bacterium]